MRDDAAAPGECIRPARPDERDALTALAVRSAAAWEDPNDPGDVDDLLVHDEDITRWQTWVLADAGDRPLGFYILRGAGEHAYLSHLFVDPSVLRTGRGKRLWLHMLATAREAGARWVEWGSDPNAAPFYRAMGATWTGEQRDIFPGWHLQLFRYDFSRGPSTSG